MAEHREPPRSPRALRNAQQARVTRFLLGTLVVLVLGASGYAVTWLRKQRREARDEISRPDSRPAAPETRQDVADSAPSTSRAASRRVFRADVAIAEIEARAEDASVESAWDTAIALRSEANAWRADGAPDVEVNKLLAAALDSENSILVRKPSFAPLRHARGQVRWPEVLGDFEDLDMRFLTKAESAQLERSLKQFEKVAASDHGWIARADYEAGAEALVRKSSEGRRLWDAMLETRVGKAAREVEIRDLAALRTLLPGARFRAFYHLPYVVLVERDDRWEEAEPAIEIARTLLGLRKTFFETYGRDMGLVPQDQRPVPVVLFTTREAYHRYCVAKKASDVLGTEAHFEPASERLILHHDCALSTILHEGTHQLIRANIRAPLSTYAQSFWFHEGIAEWFAGSRRIADGADGLPRFEIGLLMPQDLEPRGFLGPIAILKGVPKEKRIPLQQLIGLMLQDRDQLAKEAAEGLRKIHLVYAQGWLLIHFLNHFNVNEKGIVSVGAPGKYRDVWLRYLKRELEGFSGSRTFLEVLGAAGANLETIEREMSAYLEFVIRKIAKGHVRDQKLVPWNAVLGADSRPAATEADDRLE